MVLLTLFAAIAAALAVVGVYGVMAYTVSQRTQEIGVRVAMGASADAVVRLVVGQGVRAGAAGVVLGLVGAVWVSQAMRGLLFDMNGLDPLTFVVAPLVLLAAAVRRQLHPGPPRRADFADRRVEPLMSGPTVRQPASGGEPLLRYIGMLGLAAAIVNITIGGGIFRLPSSVAGSLGAAAPIAYVVCAVAMGLIVWCIADAGRRVPLTGGPYAYVGTRVRAVRRASCPACCSG